MQLHQIPMIKSYDIVGYTFNADIYCDGECILVALGELPPDTADITGMQYRELSAHSAARNSLRVARFATMDVETALNQVAATRNVNRDDESSYDSGDFPKVIFASEEFPDYCPRCALCHGVLDGFDEADYKTDDESDD